ncbi:MAG: hypothetical protein FJZ90_05710 [Chloroflexi bacterium]|nr:hypothetical protein [Chloroflexota bacterium]
MNKTHLLLVSIVFLFAVVGANVQAAPPGLPNVFYGTVQIGSEIPSDAVVVATVKGAEAVRAPVRQESVLGTVYVIDVPADDPETPEIEGGRPGDDVVFSVESPGGRQYTMLPIGTWRGGSATPLNLTAQHVVRLPLIVFSGGERSRDTSMRSHR